MSNSRAPFEKLYEDLVPGHPDPARAVQERVIYAGKTALLEALYGPGSPGDDMSVERPGEFEIETAADRLAFFVDPEAEAKAVARQAVTKAITDLITDAAGGNTTETEAGKGADQSVDKPEDENETETTQKVSDETTFLLVDEEEELAREKDMFATGSISAKGVHSYDAERTTKTESGSSSSRSDSRDRDADADIDKKKDQDEEEEDELMTMHGRDGDEDEKERDEDEAFMDRGFGELDF